MCCNCWWVGSKPFFPNNRWMHRLLISLYIFISPIFHFVSIFLSHYIKYNWSERKYRLFVNFNYHNSDEWNVRVTQRQIFAQDEWKSIRIYVFFSHKNLTIWVFFVEKLFPGKQAIKPSSKGNEDKHMPLIKRYHWANSGWFFSLSRLVFGGKTHWNEIKRRKNVFDKNNRKCFESEHFIYNVSLLKPHVKRETERTFEKKEKENLLKDETFYDRWKKKFGKLFKKLTRQQQQKQNVASIFLCAQKRSMCIRS